MKSKILKSLTWVSSLILLTLFLLSQNATAQSCPAPQQTSFHSNSSYHANGGNYYGNVNSRSGHNYSGKRSGNHYKKGQSRSSYSNRSRAGNNNYHQFNNARIGSRVNFMPNQAHRFNDRRGRTFFNYRGLTWQENICPREGRYFRAVNWIR